MVTTNILGHTENFTLTFDVQNTSASTDSLAPPTIIRRYIVATLMPSNYSTIQVCRTPNRKFATFTDLSLQRAATKQSWRRPKFTAMVFRALTILHTKRLETFPHFSSEMVCSRSSDGLLSAELAVILRCGHMVGGIITPTPGPKTIKLSDKLRQKCFSSAKLCCH